MKRKNYNKRNKREREREREKHFEKYTKSLSLRYMKNRRIFQFIPNMKIYLFVLVSGSTSGTGSVITISEVRLIGLIPVE